jgi:hypothetical protein
VSHGDDCLGSTKSGFKTTVFCSQRTLAMCKALAQRRRVSAARLPGMSGIDFVRILHNSRDWRAIRVVVISSSPSAALAAEAGALGAFLASKAEWEEDPAWFLLFLNENLGQEV